jgi:hypothetical protein
MVAAASPARFGAGGRDRSGRKAQDATTWGLATATEEGQRRLGVWLDRSGSGEQVRPELDALVESANEAAAAARRKQE